jgi:hypothetical protein
VRPLPYSIRRRTKGNLLLPLLMMNILAKLFDSLAGNGESNSVLLHL